MAIQNGFQYVSGPRKFVLSQIASDATFRERVPLTLTLDGLVNQPTGLAGQGSDVTAYYGISCHKAADSVYPGYALVEIPTPDTIYASKIATNAAASEVSVGHACDLVRSGNYFLPDEDSQVTPVVIFVPRDGYTTLDSADSSVYFSFLGNRLGVFHSNASTVIFSDES